MMDQLSSKNLVPFKKRRGAYRIPGMSSVGDEHPVSEVEDKSLNFEEQRYVRHYLNYADTLLQNEVSNEAAHLGDAAGQKGIKGSKKQAA
jgi:hypothetical protein